MLSRIVTTKTLFELNSNIFGSWIHIEKNDSDDKGNKNNNWEKNGQNTNNHCQNNFHEFYIHNKEKINQDVHNGKLKKVLELDHINVRNFFKNENK